MKSKYSALTSIGKMPCAFNSLAKNTNAGVGFGEEHYDCKPFDVTELCKMRTISVRMRHAAKASTTQRLHSGSALLTS